MYKLANTPLRRLTWTLAAILALANAGAAKSCEEAVSMAAGETWRDPGGGGSDACFEIDVAAPGLLLVELSTPEPTASPPRLLEHPGNPRASTGDRLVKGSATSFLVSFAEAGSYRLEVAAGDVTLALPAYRLRTAFLARDPRGLGESSGEQPDPIVTCTSTLSLQADGGELENPPELQADGGELENPPELQADGGELENPPEVRGTGPSGERGRGWEVYDLALSSWEMRAALAELCVHGEADDHGDGLLCATALGSGTVLGEIENPWNDDEDVFRFDLAGVRTVEISTHGPTDTTGELYDRHGNRLERTTGGGADGNFRMVRTLSPGVYFVRVAGEGSASGPYALTVRTSLR